MNVLFKIKNLIFPHKEEANNIKILFTSYHEEKICINCNAILSGT